LETAFRLLVSSTEAIEQRKSSDDDIDLHGGANNFIATLSQISGNVNDPPKLVSLVKGAIVASNNLITTLEKLASSSISSDTVSR
jgi:hypothetical protein